MKIKTSKTITCITQKGKKNKKKEIIFKLPNIHIGGGKK